MPGSFPVRFSSFAYSSRFVNDETDRNEPLTFGIIEPLEEDRDHRWTSRFVQEWTSRNRLGHTVVRFEDRGYPTRRREDW